VSLLNHRESLIDSGLINSRQLSFELARVSERIARLCLKQGLYEDSAQAFESTQKLAREDLEDNVRAARLGMDLAKVQKLAGHVERGLGSLDAYLKTQPAEIEPYQYRIVLLRELGREDEVIPSLKHFVDCDRHNIELRLLLAEEYSKNIEYWPCAQEEYQKVIQENPRSPAYQGLFHLLKTSGNVEEVLNELDRAFTAANTHNRSAGETSEAVKVPSILDAIRQDSELIRQLIHCGLGREQRSKSLNFLTRHYLALLAAGANHLDAAEIFYRSCLNDRSIVPNFSAHQREIYEGFFRVLNLQGKFEEIIKSCREAIPNTQPADSLWLHQCLAQTLGRLGQTDEALLEADQAIHLADDKTLMLCRLLRVHVLSEGNRHNNAIEECQVLLKNAVAADEIHDIRMTLYNLYSAGHDNAKAEEQIRKILHDYPDDESAYNNLGYLLAEQGKNLHEAEDLIRRALELDREHKRKRRLGAEDIQDTAAYVDSLGWVLFQTGRFPEALSELLRAASLPDGNDPVIWDHLGDVYLRLKQAVKAQESWTRAVSLYEKEKRRKPDDQYKELQHKIVLIQNP
jgi:tetratricopeptide (TPR) repeat protein